MNKLYMENQAGEIVELPAMIQDHEILDFPEAEYNNEKSFYPRDTEITIPITMSKESEMNFIMLFVKLTIWQLLDSLKKPMAGC